MHVHCKLCALLRVLCILALFKLPLIAELAIHILIDSYRRPFLRKELEWNHKLYISSINISVSDIILSVTWKMVK